MAVDYHITKLKSGIQNWNNWRLDEPDIIPDLSGSNISEIISGWNHANAASINLSDTNLGNCDLSHVSFQSADLKAANLECADLKGADLSQVIGVTYVQLEKANGDDTTILPEGISYPSSWTVTTKEDNRNTSGNDNYSLYSQNPYKILGILESASQEQIRDKYLLLVKKFHPDINSNSSEDAIRQINWAYEVLTDPEQAVRYSSTQKQNIQEDITDDYEDTLNRNWVKIRYGFIAALALSVAVLVYINYGSNLLIKKKNEIAKITPQDTEDDIAWFNAKKKNTLEALRHYKNNYPDGLYIDYAEEKIAVLIKKQADNDAFAQARKTNTELALEIYQKRYPDGQHIKKSSILLAALVKKRKLKEADDAAWANAVELNTEASLEKYQKDYPNGLHIKKSRTLIVSLVKKRKLKEADDAAWANAQQLNTEPSLENYQKNYPNGRYIEQSRILLSTLIEKRKLKEADDAAWSEAMRVNTKTSFEDYRNKFPGGAYIKNIEFQLSTLDKKDKSKATVPDEENNADKSIKKKSGAINPKANNKTIIDEVMIGPL